MDSSAVNTNVTVDDFDSVLSYADQSQWQTPDPSSSSFNASATPWWMGTYHKTDIIGASVAFNFTGPAIFIYGYSGPEYGSYEVKIDSTTTTLSAYTTTNATSSTLLYGANNLAYAPHTLTLRNLGAKNVDAGGNGFLLDYLKTTVQLAPAGATVKNVTYQETDAALVYSGTWGSNKGPVFSGGGTTYTNGDGASVMLSFEGGAIYVFGDKKNDHGLYSVVLDNGTAQVYDGVSGCGGAFGMTCEQQEPTLKYFASNLGSTTHTLKITNMAGVNGSFFDLDSIVVTVPSVYAPRALDGFSSSALSSSTSPATSSTSATTLLQPSLQLALLFVSLSWLARRCCWNT